MNRPEGWKSEHYPLVKYCSTQPSPPPPRTPRFACASERLLVVSQTEEPTGREWAMGSVLGGGIVRKDGWEVVRGNCLMRGLKSGDLGQVPCLGLTLPVCSTGLLITIFQGV